MHARASKTAAAEWLGYWLANPARRLHLLTLLAAIWLAFFCAQWFRLDKELAGARRALGQTAETAYVPPPPVLRMASLGNQAFLADLLFIRAAHYFVDHLVTDSRLPWIDMYLESIWALDAHNRTTYRWGSQVIKFGQRIDADVSKRANRFSRLGLVYFADDPWLYHEIAYNLHYAMEPKDAAATKITNDLALKYLAIAYSFPGFNYDPNYLAVQYSHAGLVDDSVRAALLNYTDATEDERRRLRRLLDDENKSQAAAELGWYDRMHERDWRYLSTGLALMIGPKHRLAPPLQPGDAQAWWSEVPTPPAMAAQLAIKDVLAPPELRSPADELPPPLPEAVSPHAK